LEPDGDNWNLAYKLEEMWFLFYVPGAGSIYRTMVSAEIQPALSPQLDHLSPQLDHPHDPA
jgi:hypothetical protein